MTSPGRRASFLCGLLGQPMTADELFAIAVKTQATLKSSRSLARSVEKLYVNVGAETTFVEFLDALVADGVVGVIDELERLERAGFVTRDLGVSVLADVWRQEPLRITPS